VKNLKAQQKSNHEVDIAFRDFSLTPDGQVVMQVLEKVFNHDKLSTGDAHTTAVRVGGAEVIRFIHRRIEDGMDG
jgi:hypothetical protein